MCMPAEDDTSLCGFNVHMRAPDGSTVVGGVLDNLFVETLVLPPAGDSVELSEVKGKLWHVDIGLHSFSQEEILLLLSEFLAEEELQ